MFLQWRIKSMLVDARELAFVKLVCSTKLPVDSAGPRAL